MRQLRVYSDGMPGSMGSNTIQIVDEDGNRVEGVVSATIWLEASEPARLDLTVFAPIINVAATVSNVTLRCGICGNDQEHECEK